MVEKESCTSWDNEDKENFFTLPNKLEIHDIRLPTLGGELRK